MIIFGKLCNFWLGLPTLIAIIWLFLLINFKFKLAKKLIGAGFSNFKYYFNRQKIKLILYIIAFLTIFIAALAPQWGQNEQLSNQSARNIVIALDVSKSMLAQDLKPNRLDFAKNKIKKLLNQLVGEQVALILFAGDALVICPLTSDQDLLLSFLDEVDYHMVSSGSTNLSAAINTATNLFNQSGSTGTNLLVIFTDGEDFSQNLDQSGILAKKVGVHIFTFGVATLQGAPVPDLDLNGNSNGFIKNKQGNIVISQLNTDLLQKVAISCGGQSAVCQVNNDQELDQMIRSIQKFERNHLVDQNLIAKPEKYYFFALIALICLLIEWVL